MMNKVAAMAAVVIMLTTGCTPKKTPTIIVDDNRSANIKGPTIPKPEDEVMINPGPKVVIVDENTSTVEVTEEHTLSAVYFAYNSPELDAKSYQQVVKNSDVFKRKGTFSTIRVEGHCDAWGSDEYNMALGLKRAKAVKEVMVNQGVDAERISMVSYGEMRPACTEKTSECYAKNRRAEFKVFDTDVND